MLNKVQMAAYELIQSDARFIYALTDMLRMQKSIKTNDILMSQPYIGVFADGRNNGVEKLVYKLRSLMLLRKSIILF